MGNCLRFTHDARRSGLYPALPSRSRRPAARPWGSRRRLRSSRARANTIVISLMADDHESGDSFDDIVKALDHDLRNPVANILGFVDLLRDTPGAAFTGEQLEFLTRIEDNCRTLLEMLTRLRDVAIADEDDA